MTLLVLWWLSVGLADIWRVEDRRTTGPKIALAGGTAAAVPLVVALGVGVDAGQAFGAAGLCAAAYAAWVCATEGAQDDADEAGASSAPPSDRHKRCATAGVAVVVFASVSALAGGAWLGDPGGAVAQWFCELPYPAASEGTVGPAAAFVAAVVVMTRTGNHLVQCVLVTTGTRGGASKVLGGRLIGPVERLLIVGFAVTGHWEAAALVVTAKSILRFPEIGGGDRSGRDEPAAGAAGDSAGAGNVADGAKTSRVGIVEPVQVRSEYVLVGSLISWLIAFAAAAVVSLA